MNMKKSITFTRLELENFRIHKNRVSFDFGDTVLISGRGEIGKTTIVHGITYALYGVNAYGEQSINKIRHKDSASVEAVLDFITADGTTRRLIRSRKHDKTTLTLDSYTVKQAQIDQFICDKNTFLSMFCTSFLTERSGAEGRELVERYLPDVPVDTVLGSLSESYRETLLGLNITNPTDMIAGFREEIRSTEDSICFLEGKLEAVSDGNCANKSKLSELKTELEASEMKLSDLRAFMYKDIDTDDLKIKREMLVNLLAGSAENSEISRLQQEINNLKNSVYDSKFRDSIIETNAEIKNTADSFRQLEARINNMKPGEKCPSCSVVMSSDIFDSVKVGFMRSLEEIRKNGSDLLATRGEIIATDKKARDTFEQFRQEDIKNKSARLAELQNNSGNKSEIGASIEKIDEQLRVGNLSDEQHAEMVSLDAEIVGLKAQISALSESSVTDDIIKLMNDKDALEEIISNRRSIISALAEFISKRAEISLAAVKMPNVELKLFEIVHSTGEVKSVFKFLYKGIDYDSLSFSQRILAGIEIAAMMRNISGIDCPIFIDNTESINNFNDVEMPSQVFLLRMVKDQSLRVQSKMNQPRSEAA